MAAAQIGFTVANDTTPYSWVIETLEATTFHTPQDWRDFWRPEDGSDTTGNSDIENGMRHIRFTAIADYAFVTTIKRRVDYIFNPMVEGLNSESLYAAYGIDIEEWKSKIRILLEAINFVKTISLMTHAITNPYVSDDATIVTRDEFNTLVDTIKRNFEGDYNLFDHKIIKYQARRLNIGEYNNIRAEHYWVDPLEGRAAEVFSRMVMAHLTNNFDMVYNLLEEVSDSEYYSFKKYPYENVAEQRNLLRSLRELLPEAITRIKVNVAKLNTMPDYGSLSDHGLYRIREQQSHTHDFAGDLEL